MEMEVPEFVFLKHCAVHGKLKKAIEHIEALVPIYRHHAFFTLQI